MKICEIENSTPLERLEMAEMVANNIQDNCSTAIKSFNVCQNLLFSGIYNHTEFSFTSHSPEHRTPRGMSKEQQLYLDSCLRIMGFTALRSNSMFCIADYMQAKNFGELYIIFPCDGFSFTWSKKRKYMSWINTPHGPLLASRADASATISIFGLKNKNFVNAVNSGNEILIHGDYYALKVYTDGAARVLKKLGIF
jgi:hypothetical protein